MICPVKALFRIAIATKEIGLPGCDRGDAWHFIQFTLVGNRVGCVWRGRSQHQIDLVLFDQFGGHFSGTVRARLRILDNDLHIHRLAVVFKTGKGLFHALKNEGIRFTKTRKRAGLRRNIADGEGCLCGRGLRHAQNCRGRKTCRSPLQKTTAIDDEMI